MDALSPSTTRSPGGNVAPWEKVAQVLAKLRRVRGLSEEQKDLFARSLAATPKERWRLPESFLRSHD